VYDLMALGSSVTGAAAVTLVRSLRRDHGPLTLSLAFFSGAVAVTLVPALWLWKAPTGPEWLTLLAVGGVNLGGQVLFATSLRTLLAIEASVLSQLVVVFSFAGGQLFLAERLPAIGLVGAALTLVGVVGVMLAAARRPPP
jgi:drug/metabolite transporter (DMT)-like permease